MTATTGRPLATDYGRDVRDFVGTHVASRIDEWERDRQPAPGMLEALAAAGLLAPCSHVAPDGLAHRLALAEALGAKGALGAALAVASQLGTPLGVLELAPRAASDARWRRLAEEARAGAVAGAAHVSEPAYDGRLLVPAPICLTRADDALELRGECTDVLNGPVAQFAVVTARVAAGLPGAGWALVLLPLDAPGVHVQRRATLGLHTASMGRILLEDCKVSPDHLLATMPEDCALVRELLAEDRLPASAALLAVGRLLFDDTVAHVKTRAHAAGTLADLQTVRHRLADLRAELDIASAFLNEVSNEASRERLAGQRAFPRRAAEVKLVVAESVQRVADCAVQLFGGSGFLRETRATRLYRDLVAGVLVGGAPDVMRELVARERLASARGPAGTSPPPPRPGPFRAEVRRFVEREVRPHQDAWEFEEKLPRALFRRFAHAGLMGLSVPRAQGGSGRGLRANLIVSEELLAVGAVSVALSVMLPATTIGPLLSKYGSADILRRFLTPLLQGELVASLAVTEPRGGADVLHAVKCWAEDAGSDWIITGEKKFITNGPIADVIFLLARTEATISPFAMTLIAVPTATPGFEASRLSTLGACASPTGLLRFRGCRVPKENTIGRPRFGFVQLADVLGPERLLVAAGATALARTCVAETVSCLRRRRRSGDRLALDAPTRHRLAGLAARLAADRAFAWTAAEELARDPGAGALSCLLAKFALAESAQRIITQCLHLQGLAGLRQGGRCEQALRDARLLTVGAGPSEIMRELAGARIVGRHSSPGEEGHAPL